MLGLPGLTARPFAGFHAGAMPHVRPRGIMGFDDGGVVGGIGGVSPAQSASSPMVQGLVQRYAGLPTEKLQEMSAMLGQGSGQGQIVQKVLQQRLTQPNAQPAQPPQQAQQAPQFGLPQAAQPARRGGGIAAYAGGGMLGMSQADPWWTRSEAGQVDRSQGTTGYLHGATPGRADQIATTAPAGSYVIPADVVAGIGEGNNLAGARFIQDAMATGPWGTPVPHLAGRPNLPHPPPRVEVAKGGGIGNAAPTPRDVLLSHGEYVLTPEEVTAFGGGDHDHGVSALDKWVVAERAKQIKDLKKLPGPVKVNK